MWCQVLPGLLHTHPAAGLLQQGLQYRPKICSLSVPKGTLCCCRKMVVAPCWHVTALGRAMGGVFWQQRTRAVPRMPVMPCCGFLGPTWCCLRNRNCLSVITSEIRGCDYESCNNAQPPHSGALGTRHLFVFLCWGTHSTYEILVHCFMRHSAREWIVPACALCLELC